MAIVSAVLTLSSSPDRPRRVGAFGKGYGGCSHACLDNGARASSTPVGLFRHPLRTSDPHANPHGKPNCGCRAPDAQSSASRRTASHSEIQTVIRKPRSIHNIAPQSAGSTAMSSTLTLFVASPGVPEKDFWATNVNGAQASLAAATNDGRG
jgi:hypothetical protein